MHRPKSPRLAVGGLIIMLLLVSLIPAVSAEEFSGRIYDVKSDSMEITAINSTSKDADGAPYTWRINYDPQKAQTPSEIHVFDSIVTCYPQPYEVTFASIDNIRHYYGTVNDGSQVVADVKLEVIKNDFHAPSYGGFTFSFYFDNWNTTYLNTLSTVTDFTFVMDGEMPTYTISMHFIESPIPSELGTYLHHKDASAYLPVSRVELIRYYYPVSYFEHEYTISTDDYGTSIDIIRNFAAQNPSKLKIMLYNGDVIYESTTYETADQTYIFSHTGLTIDIITPDETYRILQGGDPDLVATDPGVLTIYVKSSQTGALLANANLAILASAGGTEVEIINATLPGGTGTYTLQPTGGGSPNPDYYRAVATVPGFSQIIENHSFTLSGPHDVIIEMRPDSGGPLDPERAYLEFYVRDLNANPIPAASIQCNNQIKQTNSAGYAVFEVAKNASHPWIAKRANYVTIEGTATTGPNPRYVVNVVLGPGTVPTYTPTPGPGETPGATPTPDTRTNEQKGQAIIDLIADFAEPIALLAIVATVFGLMQMMMPRRR